MPLPPNQDEPVKGTIKLEPPPLGEESIGGTIGPYKLLEQVGEGGFGVVYVAEQREPVKRRVALKIIKLGMDTRQVVARFEAERQALALMDHPNIAKVFDAGATGKGRPYFAMELVRGIPITKYCDQEKINTRDRLELFIKVCQAIQHAHQKGIIHRDIKPSNILVALHDGVPVPKVIDFGIAKATQQDLTDKTLYTQLQQFIGTPAYMSPEQAEMSGLDIDTRSDIYSLGVLLYELLTGRTPFDPNELMRGGVDAMRKTIREQEPVRPSTKVATLLGDDLSTTAARHSAHPPKLVSSLRGDLDWIVMKCLEKDRTRRYETANGLAFDLKRHLNNETVMARPPSAAYRLQKAIRRNKLAYAAGLAVFCALIIGLGAATAMFFRARRALAGEQVQRQQAEVNEKKAGQAQAAEAELRHQAEVAELAARRRAYASDMFVANQALDENNLGRALELLERQRPESGQRDLRGWEWRYLWEQTRSTALFTFCQETRPVSALAVSADGDFLATGEFGRGSMIVWDWRTRRELYRMSNDVWGSCVAFSPAEPLLAYSTGALRGADNVGSDIHLWKAATRQAVRDFPVDGNCLGLMFSADGQTLLTSTAAPRGGSLALWRVTDGKMMASYTVRQPGLGGQAHAFAATADLRLAAYGALEKRFHVVDLRDGKDLWSGEASKLRVTALAFSPDQKLLASAAGYEEKDIRLWDVATGRQTGLLEGHNMFVSSLLFLPDGKRLASTSFDGTIRTWDLASLQPLDVLRGHRHGVCTMVMLPDSRTLLSSSVDGAVFGWDITVPHPQDRRITLPGNITTFRFTPDSRALITVDRDARVTRWSGSDFRHAGRVLDLATNDIVRGPNLRWYHLFSRDAQFLVIGSTNGVIRLWDLASRQLSRQITNAATQHLMPVALLDGGRKVITGEPFELHEWDLETGAAIQAWPSSWDPICLSPDESSCVAFANAESLTIRDLNHQTTKPIAASDALYGRCAFSPDGRRFTIVGPYGSYLSFWNAATWERTQILTNSLAPMTRSITFSPDGARLFLGRAVGPLQIWDAESGQPLIDLDADGGESVESSPDGNTIADLEAAGTLCLWRAPSWEEISAVEGADKARVQK